MKKNLLWIVLAVVLVAAAGVGGYFLGVKEGKTQTTSIRDQFIAERFGPTGQGGQPGQGQLQLPEGQTGSGEQPGARGQMFIGGRGATIATIKEIQGSTLIASTDENELKIIVDADTQITVTSQGSISDLKAGDRITVAGETSGDTLTATQIQVIPQIP